MASDYPGALDTFTDMSTTLSGPPTHSSVHGKVHDALEAIQGELGTAPSGSFATVKARIESLETRREIRLSRSTSQSLTEDAATSISWTVEDSDPFGGVSVPVTAVPVGATLGAGIYMFLFILPNLQNGVVVRTVLSTFGTLYSEARTLGPTYCIGPVPVGASETVTVDVFTDNPGQTLSSGAKFIAYRMGA